MSKETSFKIFDSDQMEKIFHFDVMKYMFNPERMDELYKLNKKNVDDLFNYEANRNVAKINNTNILKLLDTFTELVKLNNTYIQETHKIVIELIEHINHFTYNSDEN